MKDLYKEIFFQEVLAKDFFSGYVWEFGSFSCLVIDFLIDPSASVVWKSRLLLFVSSHLASVPWCLLD